MNKSLNHSVYQITMINYVSEDKDPRVTVKPKTLTITKKDKNFSSYIKC